MRVLTRFALLFSAVALPLACGAQDGSGPLKYQEQVDYGTVRQASKPDVPSGKVEVAEVFSYGCNHCYNFAPAVKNWLENDKADNVEFTLVPFSLGRPAALAHSKAHYAALQLGVLDEIHKSLFDAIHKRKKQMTSEAELAKLFEDAGIEKEEFSKVFNSFGVNSRVQRAEALIRQWGIASVPMIVVDGQYVTGSRYTRSNKKALDVANFLATVQP